MQENSQAQSNAPERRRYEGIGVKVNVMDVHSGANLHFFVQKEKVRLLKGNALQAELEMTGPQTLVGDWGKLEVAVSEKIAARLSVEVEPKRFVVIEIIDELQDGGARGTWNIANHHRQGLFITAINSER